MGVMYRQGRTEQLKVGGETEGGRRMLRKINSFREILHKMLLKCLFTVESTERRYGRSEDIMCLIIFTTSLA